ncbi:hypothetical protein [Actinoplanes sp. NPDC049118]
MSGDRDQRRSLRGRFAAATVTGLVAGAVRALADWMLRRLTPGD